MYTIIVVAESPDGVLTLSEFLDVSRPPSRTDVERKVRRMIPQELWDDVDIHNVLVVQGTIIEDVPVRLK